MMLVRGTKKFLDRVGPPEPGEHVAAGVLGDWYANALFWRPQTALFVNERSLVLLPLAPAATVLDRFPAAFARVAAAIGVDRAVLDVELATMQTHALAKTASRRVLGVMNDFAQRLPSTTGNSTTRSASWPCRCGLPQCRAALSTRATSAPIEPSRRYSADQPAPVDRDSGSPSGLPRRGWLRENRENRRENHPAVKGGQRRTTVVS